MLSSEGFSIVVSKIGAPRSERRARYWEEKGRGL